MLLESLEAENFRNLSGNIFWGSELNIIVGDNGQGKTNWLEAIHILATTKSFRTQRLQESIQFGHDSALIRGRIKRHHDVNRDLRIAVQGSSKAISINGKRETISRYLEQLYTVAFTADEMNVVRGLPDARRTFLDRGVVALRPAYVKTITDFSRVLKQKNRIFKEANEKGYTLDRVKDLIEPWNQQLVRLSLQIHDARTGYVARLNEALERGLFRGEEIHVCYVSSLEGKGQMGDYTSLIAERLALRLPAEIAVGYSLVGPHRDELEILCDGRDIRSFGSAGQQRSALILLNLAAISVYNKIHSEYPLFLIDDIDTELDRKRITYLLEYLHGRTQTFITTSKESLVEQFSPRSTVYKIDNGRLEGDGVCRELAFSSANFGP